MTIEKTATEALEKAATELAKVADDIEKQASEVTKFVCGKCSHTATLASINDKRKKTAGEVDKNIVVTDVSVNDKISCPACDGVMSYTATEESTPYYYDPDSKVAAKPSAEEIKEEKKETPEEQAREEKGEKLHEEPHKEASEPIDYDSLDVYLKG
jgi:hypothetical protein